MKSFRMGYGLGGLLQKLMKVSGNYGIENTLDPDGAATMANYLAGGGTQTQSPDGSTTYTSGMNIPAGAGKGFNFPIAKPPYPGRPNPAPFPIPPNIMPPYPGKPNPAPFPIPPNIMPPFGGPPPPPMTIPKPGPGKPGGGPMKPGTIIHGKPTPGPGGSPSRVPNPYTYGYGPSADFGRRNLDALTYTKGTSTPTLEQLFGRRNIKSGLWRRTKPGRKTGWKT